MLKNFDVTVIVPTYQAAPFLKKTLETVAIQTIKPVELIVVDDGSSDETVDVIMKFCKENLELQVRLLRETHRGPGAARNSGIKAAKTHWIAFLDSDDLWHPQKLEKMFAAIVDNPQSNFFCHNEYVRYLDGSEITVDYSDGFQVSQPIEEQLYRKNYFSTSAVICCRELLEKWGGFDETLSSAQDYELWLRISPDISPIFVTHILGTYIYRKGNISTSKHWRRLVNRLRVKHKHRKKVGSMLYIYSMFTIPLIHATSMLSNSIKKSIGAVLRH